MLSTEFPDIDNVDHLPTSTSFAEKKRVWELHKDIPMVCWKANMVLAWLEVECQMSVYSQMCYENIKSGKVLLELTDAELEAGLGIANTMHRRKLRLAIEEYREPVSRLVKHGLEIYIQLRLADKTVLTDKPHSELRASVW